jgi:integrase
VFKEAVRQDGVNHWVTVMDFHHNAASNMSAAGIDLVTVAQNTGHSVQVLMATYAHAVDRALQEAAETMEAVINGR